MAPGYGIVNGYVMFKKCPDKQLKEIQDEFGDFLEVTVNKRGGMDGSVHKHFFLDTVFKRTTEILRNTWGKTNAILLCLDDRD
jgi:hypothetical protein